MNSNGNHSDDMPLEPSVPLSEYETGIYGEPEKLPRVGNQYQVEIPAIISKSQYKSYRKNPLEGGNMGGLHDLVMGLPLSIMWVNQEVHPIEDDKIDFSNDLKHSSKRSRHYELNAESIDVASGSVNSETNELEQKTDQIRGFLVPGSCGDSWSDIEKASFVLGLYIFQKYFKGKPCAKDFVRIKKFVETKRMGEILLFYYGKFYRTPEYRRWSGCRKGTFRMCAVGERLFIGMRLQELLSRLVQGISVELQSALMLVSKTFSDRKMSLEDYIFCLKNMVGMKALIDAIGIGSGKQDLTGPIIEVSNSNQAVHCRPEFPFGKACSSLSRNEIIEILTGNQRLSKARSYELFWEAVWPILVEKGWDAVESSNHSYAATSKQSHMFFAPGVSKSSRKGLVKGVHYFDSATDVLTRIASDPRIIDLDKRVDEEKAKTQVENNNEDLPERQHHCHLQPQTPCQSSDVSTSVGDQKNKPNDWPMFDLNCPPPHDSDCDDIGVDVPEPQIDLNELNEPMAEAEANNVQNLSNQQTEPMARAEAKNSEEEEEQVNLQSRRQSSRNRPLTTRALEAIAQGFLTVNNRKRRGGNHLGGD